MDRVEAVIADTNGVVKNKLERIEGGRLMKGGLGLRRAR